MKFLESISWYAYRLRAMKPAEIGHRLEERWRQWNEPGFLKSLEGFDPGPASIKVPRLPDKGDAMAELRAQLAEDAVRLQRGTWQLFGWRDVEVGAPPCWHRDAFCGVVIDPDKPAHQLNHRRLPDGADARTIWEINRWAEMTRLAMHGWLNEDIAAIRTAQLWLEDWCDRNPPGRGINWTSPLEAALRLINFAWFDALVEAAVRLPGAGSLILNQKALVERIVPVHAAWVWRYRSAGSSANNHLLGELAALVVAVSRWPRLDKVACPAGTAWEMLGHEVLNQFAGDGGSREQALHYHLFAFDLAWQAARAVGCRAGDVHERLLSAAGYFQGLAQGSEPWDFGDNDDAQVVPFTQRRSQAAKEWLEWFLGEKGTMHFWLGASPLAAVGQAVSFFPESGMAAVCADGWKARMDASPLGFGTLAAHGHGDALHVSLWDGDEALLIDPGTGGYYGHQELRTELAAWEAHNGPLPGTGYRTPRRLGPFLWAQHHPLPSLVVEGHMMAAQFQHEGHSFQRTVHLQKDAVQIRDMEAGRRPFVIRLTFSPECQLKPRTSGNEPTYLIIRGSRRWELRIQAVGACDALTERRVSSAYGRIETACVLTVASVDGELSFMIQRMG